MPRFSAHDLTRFAADVLMAGQAAPDEAERVAASLVGANLRGYDSHGVMRLPDYVTRLGNGQMRSGVELAVLAESAGHIAADAQWGLGQVQMERLLTLMLAKLPATPVVAGTLRNAGHVGRLGEYCEWAAERGLISQICVNNNGAARRVAPPGGKSPRLSTNPLAIGVPHGNAPLVIDMSTSATAEGKVRVKKIAGERCPEGWLIDSEGNPTTDPNVLYANPPGAILPMGGPQAYKGFGLALAIEVLAGAVSGGQVTQAGKPPQIGNCVFVLLLDPARFCGTQHFVDQVNGLSQFVRDTPRIDPTAEIVLPGDPERKLLAERHHTGISIDTENWKALRELALTLGVETPSGE